MPHLLSPQGAHHEIHTFGALPVQAFVQGSDRELFLSTISTRKFAFILCWKTNGECMQGLDLFILYSGL
jgi:hypothetical protein